MISELHVELARLAATLPPDVRENITALKNIPREVLQKFIPDYKASQDDGKRPKRKPQDYGNRYEKTLEVLTAIEGDDFEKLLLKDDILGDQKPAKILNVVASVKLADHLDLDHIASKAWNVEYNKKNFSGLVIQVNNPKATGVVYSTGRMMITGARCEKDSKIAAEKCIEILRNAECKINGGESYRIQNICATQHLGYRIRIHEMGSPSNNAIKDWGKVVNFSPEIFAGLVCNFENPKVTVVCFATGTLLFSGAHMEEDVQIALERFRILSFPYRY